MYDQKMLQKIARETLATARENLIRDGRLQPCGLVFTSAGMTHVFPVEFRDIQEKRVIQGAFRYLLRQVQAEAAVMVMESWVKMADEDVPLDLSRPVSGMPGRGEAIVIEARSAHGRVMIIQVFRKTRDGYHFDEPIEPQAPFEWTSEWLDGVWEHSGH